MSAAPFNLNSDLKRLREEGYYVQIVGGFLVMREVPYVNAQLEVKTGTLISSLETLLKSQSRTRFTLMETIRAIPRVRPSKLLHIRALRWIWDMG